MVTKTGWERRAAVFAGLPPNLSSPGHGIAPQLRLTYGIYGFIALARQRREKPGDWMVVQGVSSEPVSGAEEAISLLNREKTGNFRRINPESLIYMI